MKEVRKMELVVGSKVMPKTDFNGFTSGEVWTVTGFRLISDIPVVDLVNEAGQTKVWHASQGSVRMIGLQEDDENPVAEYMTPEEEQEIISAALDALWYYTDLKPKTRRRFARLEARYAPSVVRKMGVTEK